MNNWPVVYSCRLMEPGIISYQDSGDGIAYVPKETIDRIVPSIIGKPVVIKHQNVTPANAHEHAVGHVIGAHYNPSDAWHYVDFLITSDKIEAIEKEDGSTAFKDTKGNVLDGVSGAYDVLNASGGGVWHDIKFDHKIIDGSFTHLALVNNPRYEETNRIVERMPSMLVNGKVAVMNKPKENSVDNYYYTIHGERFRIYIKQATDGRFYCEAQDKAGTVVHTTLPQGNEAEARYACESMLYLQTRNSKDNAKMVIIDIPFRLISKVGDKEGLSDAEVEAKLRAKGLHSVGAGGGDATFEFEGTEQQAAQAVKEVLGTLSSVSIGALANSSGQAAFEKEKKEHPEFTDEQIWKIVRDHEEKKNASLDENQRAVLKWMDDTNTGAIPREGKWYFKENIRLDANLARAIKEYLNLPAKENSVVFSNGRAGVFKKGEVVRDINGVYCKIVGEAQSGEYYVVQYPDGSTDRMREADINANSKTEYEYKQNSKEAQMNLFKIFKKLVNGEEEVTDLAVDIDGKNVAVNDLIEAYKTDEAEEAKRKANEKEAEEKRKKDEEDKAKENARKNLRMAKDEDTVDIDGKKVSIADLKNCYARKNARNSKGESKENSYGNVYIDADIKRGDSKEMIIGKIMGRYSDIDRAQAEEIYDAVKKGGPDAKADWSHRGNDKNETPEEKAEREKKEKEDAEKAENEKREAEQKEKEKKEAEEKENAKKTAQAKNIELCNSKKAAGEIFMATNAKLTPGDPVQLGAGHYTVTELGENPIGTAGVWLKENAKKGEEFFTRIQNAGNEPQKPALDAPVGRQERAARSTSKHSSKQD